MYPSSRGSPVSSCSVMSSNFVASASRSESSAEWSATMTGDYVAVRIDATNCTRAAPATYALSGMEDVLRAIVFDLDGVLVDSRIPISKSIGYALEAQGLPQPKLDHLERFIGPPLTAAFAELVGCPPDSPLVLACLASYRDRYREASLRETTVFPGISEALTVLASSHRLAVATSKPLAFAEPLLSALDLRASFEHVAGPDLDVHREDKETTIRRVLSALGTTRAVMVGDRSVRHPRRTRLRHHRHRRLLGHRRCKRADRRRCRLHRERSRRPAHSDRRSSRRPFGRPGLMLTRPSLQCGSAGGSRSTPSARCTHATSCHAPSFQPIRR